MATAAAHTAEPMAEACRVGGDIVCGAGAASDSVKCARASAAAAIARRGVEDAQKPADAATLF